MINIELAYQVYQRIVGNSVETLFTTKDLVYYWIGVTENPAYHSGVAIAQTARWCRGLQLRPISPLEIEPMRPVDLPDWDDSVVQLLRAANLIDLGSEQDIIPSSSFRVIVVTPTSQVHIDSNRVLIEDNFARRLDIALENEYDKLQKVYTWRELWKYERIAKKLLDESGEWE